MTVSFTPITDTPAPVTGGSLLSGGSKVSFTPIGNMEPSSPPPSGPNTRSDPGSPGDFLDKVSVPTFFPASSYDSQLTAGLKTAGNLIPSAINFGLGMAKMPIQGVENIAKDVTGFTDAAKNFGGGSVLKGLIPAAGSLAYNLPGAAYKSLVPQSTQQIIAGDTSGAAQSITNDPVGQVLPYLLLGREAAYKVSDAAGAAFDSTISKIATPATATGEAIGSIAGKATGLAGSMGRFATSQATGIFPQTIQTITDNPEVFSKANITTIDRPAVASTIKDVLDQRIQDLSETGQAYDKVRKMENPNAPGTGLPLKIPVRPDALLNIIRNATGLSIEQAPEIGKEGLPMITTEGDPISTGGQLSTTGSAAIRAPADITALQKKIVNVWQPEFEKGYLTPDEFLNLRSDLAGMAKYEGGIGKSTPLENLASVMRGQLNTLYRNRIPGLEDLDANFFSQISELKTLRNGILDKEGNLTDASINRIANATNKGRSIFLNKLEEISPGITKRIQILKAIEDLENVEGQKVGTYTRAAIGGGGVTAGLMTGNIPMVAAAVAEMIISSPSVAVPLMRAYGFSKELMSAVISQLKSGATSINQSTQSLPTMGSLAPSIAGGAKGSL